MKHSGYCDTVEYIDTIYYKNYDVDRSLDPACISRCWATFLISEQIDVLSWDKLKQMYSYGPPTPGIMQKFIYSPTNKATLYRIVFHNPNNSDERADFGY